MDNNEFCNYISSLCIRAILYEVNASPKPGLVDRFNPGAHGDMDIYTFMNSSSVLFPYFYKCTRLGLDFKGKDYRELMEALRPIGIEAENHMFKATAGINTHKGVIFSFGIVAAASGSLFKDKASIYFDLDQIRKILASMTRGISRELEEGRQKTNPSYGERLYISYGVKGIRGEAESSFKTLMDNAFPVLENLMKEAKHHINDILVHSLLYLIAKTEDSNILGRHSMELLNYAQEEAKKAIDQGGFLTDEGRVKVHKMDKDFIEKNISPGGAADLLGLGLLFYYLKYGID